jgi:hypothetical protein
MRSNDVRAPEVPRGEVVIVGRYSEKKPKVALINPADLAMLEHAHDTLQAFGRLDDLPVDELTLKTLAIEDRPDPQSIEDPEAIAAALGL